MYPIAIVHRAVGAVVFLALTTGAAFPQANGDPGASLAGQTAVEKAPKPAVPPKSGANAMPKGTSGETGDAHSMTAGSNAKSGSGAVDQGGKK